MMSTAQKTITAAHVTNISVDDESSVMAKNNETNKQQFSDVSNDGDDDDDDGDSRGDFGDSCDGDDNDDDDSSSIISEAERKAMIHQTLRTEQQWYQNLVAIEMFTKLESILRAVCKRLNITTKIDSSIKLGAANPTTEKLTLMQRTGTEIFKCSVILLGESVIQTEVTMKYPKMPGGVYRATAQPDVQWKLQQLLDVNNYCARALSTTVRALKWIKRIQPSDDYSKTSSTVIDIVAEITNLIGQARTTLCTPRKRTLLELCNTPITRCFNPPLPPDLVFSYYISTNRLVCAAYQVTPKANGAQNLTVTLADCFLPQLVDVLLLTDRALNTAQQFSGNTCMIRDRMRTFATSDQASMRF